MQTSFAPWMGNEQALPQRIGALKFARETWEGLPMANSDALYYPFSRCMGDRVLKQYLLLFDSITFLDPVDDDDWRAILFEDVEYEDARYASYRDLSGAMPWLRREGLIKVHSPDRLQSKEHDITVAATLADLADAGWVRSADPRPYDIPTQTFAGEPSWNVFRPKIPDGVVAALYEDPALQGHLLADGGERYAWQLSYAAGSSIGINVHLAAAEELSLAPVTDSRLHHHLMLRKLRRGVGVDMTPSELDDFTQAIATRTVFKVLEAIVPPAALDRLSLEDILRFRDDTEYLRESFLDEVTRAISAEVDPENPLQNERLVAKVTDNLTERARVYGAELQNARDLLWPRLIDVARTPTALGGAAVALAASYITGSGYVVCASALLPSLGVLKAIAEWKAGRDKVTNSSASSIAYLSQVGGLT